VVVRIVADLTLAPTAIVTEGFPSAMSADSKRQSSSAAAAAPRLTELFNYSHVKPVSRSGWPRRLCLVLYTPFGLALMLLRAAVVLLLCVFLYLAPKRFFFPPLAARCFGLLFGIVLRYRVKSGDGSHAALRTMFAKNRPLILAANHCTCVWIALRLPIFFVHLLLLAGLLMSCRSCSCTL
jgi:hypothetical protein